MSVLTDLKKGNISLVGKIVERGGRSTLVSPPWQVVYVITGEDGAAVLICSSSKERGKVGDEYKLTLTLDWTLIDKELAWKNYKAELEKAAKKYPSIR